jgi:hypothetical protein
MMCGIYGKTDSETIGETFNETNSKQNEKMTSNLLCPRKTMDRNKQFQQPLKTQSSHQLLKRSKIWSQAGRSISCTRNVKKSHGRKNQVKLHSIQERTNGLAGLETSENKLPQKDGSKTRGTI